ncbi:hypothetical protein pdam_00024609, partial [Pocillopora damicornis]
MSQQSATYSSHRGINSFKVIIGVAPNAVITYVSNHCTGVGPPQSLNYQDIVLANKGFLIQDIVPHGVSVNIPPFLNKGAFTGSVAKATKAIGRYCIYVERTSEFLAFIPSYLRCYSDILLQLCATPVNLQFPLVKEGCEDR